MKKDRILKISIGLLGIIGIFFVIGITYAYWSSTHKEEEDNILSSSCFNLELKASNIVSEGNVPMTDKDAENLVPYTFTITNACKTSAEVGVNLDILKTTTADLSHYKISLNNGKILIPTMINDLEDDEVANDDTLLTKKLANIYINRESEKTLELRLWMDETVGVGEGEHEIIESKISLSANAIPVELSPVAEKIIADRGGLFKVRGQKDVDLKQISPELVYSQAITENNTTKVASVVLTNKLYSNEYEFDAINGTYSLINPISEPLDEEKVGMYTCNNTTGTNCTTMYKIKEVDFNPATVKYEAVTTPVEKSVNTNSTIAGNKKVGKSYHFNELTGRYVLDDIVTGVSYTEDYIGYYACGTATNVVGTATTCPIAQGVHKIKEVSSSPGEGNYYSNVTENQTVSYTSASNKTVSSTFTFDNSTGTYTLNDPISSVSYSSDYVGYYTCNTTATSCTTLYLIKEVSDTTATKVDRMVKTTRYNYVKKTDFYARKTNSSYITLSDKYTKSGTKDDYIKERIGMYQGEDDFGDTFYFRGGNDYNNLYFAGYYWNIVRINGDGSLRLIYRGETPTATGEATQIDKSYFNSSSSYNAYGGYMFGTPNGGSYSLEHENKNDSITKQKLDLWYENNLLAQENYIADSIFCNDRSLFQGYEESGYGNYATYYNGYHRIRLSYNLTPTLKCKQKNDRLTVSNEYGSQNLKYPIGLLTADEAAFAGLYSNIMSTCNYLNTGISYWTMTPSNFSSYISLHLITSGGRETTASATSTYGVRPVINLKGNVILSGTGTIEDPYVVEGLQAG